ncbi:MAG: nucleotidyl transferase AbiEii/AbiGii toxin family protein [Micrococcales bacterium]|nr:nucleotidyl transferase AbiEii/AbiGii toxin family protein [Micrococcales bacterium]
MTSEVPYNLSGALEALKMKDKIPRSGRVLDVWIAQAERNLHSDGGRLGWLVASTVVAAVLQQGLDESGAPAFLLKGGSLLQHKFRDPTRTTTDVDGLVRVDLDVFLSSLDSLLEKPWGPFGFSRGEVEVIEVPYKVIKPRRFDLFVKLNGQTWRRVQVELSPDEGNAGATIDRIKAPSLAGFGLPTPDHLASLSMQYQIAQKVHAATDPHDPPEEVNDRARDLVDLLLLRDLSNDTGQPDRSSIKVAILDIFTARAAEAEALCRTPRHWPARLVAYPHWRADFDQAARSAGLDITLKEAVAQVNAWLDQIDET